MKRALVLIRFIISILMFLPVLSLASPNFSGTWRLDTDRSDLGNKGAAPKAPMKEVIIKIHHTGEQMTVERATGELATYRFDGSECVNTLPNGGQSRTKLTWAGDKLLGATVSNVGGAEIKMEDDRSLSGDGKEMTVHLTIHMPNGDRNQTLIYVKQ